MPSGYGLLPVSAPTTGPTPSPMMQDDDHFGQPAEDVGVDPGRPAQPARPGDARDGEPHAEDQADDAGADGEDQGVGQAGLEQVGDGLLVEVPVEERVLELGQRRFRRASPGCRLGAWLAAIAAKSGSCGSGRGLGAGLPARRQRARHPVGVQPRPRAVGDHRVEPGVERVDERLVLLGHRVGDEVVQAEGVLDDLRRIARLHGALGLLRRRDPGVDLAGLQAGVHGVVVGELHRVQAEGVDDVGLLHGALHDADALAGGELVEAGDRRPGGHHQREVAEVVAVGEADGAGAAHRWW